MSCYIAAATAAEVTRMRSSVLFIAAFCLTLYQQWVTTDAAVDQFRQDDGKLFTSLLPTDSHTCLQYADIECTMYT